jgi:hypothetical protein
MGRKTSYRTMETKLKKQDALYIQMIQQKRKGEENYWVMSIIMDDPEFPNFDQRITFSGTCEQCAKDCVAMTHVIVERGFPKSGIRIESYQGDKARFYLAEGERQEAKYQGFIKSQPSN